MSDSPVQWQPPEVQIDGGGRFPVRHAWCVGRNYADHAREMGVDPERSEPVFFSKPARAVCNDSEVRYPPDTKRLDHEVELVVFLAHGGREVPAAEWAQRIFGYAVGVDLTRRDLQEQLKKAGQPWEVSKGFDQSGPVGAVCRAGQWQPDIGRTIALQVNGMVRQQADLDQMIWSVGDLLERLSARFSLSAGDVVFTGTPAGVGPLVPGDRVVARIDGLAPLEFAIQPS